MNIIRINDANQAKHLTLMLTAVLLLSLLVFAPGAQASPAASQSFAEAAGAAPDWIIEVWPTAECSGWSVEFAGSNSNGEDWRVKVDGDIIASGTTTGNETVSGAWPPAVDLSQSHTFRAEIYEHGNWLAREDSFGPCSPPQDICYGVADGYDNLNDGGAEDTLAFLNKLTGQTAPVGGVYPNTGTNNIEAIAFQPGGQTLFAANAGQLGTLNLSTGAFTALSQPFGTGDGSAGSITFSDVDGLSFDVTTGVLYGTHRRGGDDLLLQIDPSSGAHVPNAFGSGVDYVEIASGSSLPDTDDIASDPVSGVMFASINDGGSSANKLMILNTTTGAITEVGTIKDGSGANVQDVEGLSFFNDGLLYGTTGKNGPTTNGLWRIDKNTAIATFIGNFSSPLKDFEGSDCLTAGAFIVLDKEASVAEARVGDTITYSYTIKNTGGVVLDPVTLDDDRLGALLTVGDGVSLVSGASTLVNATYTVLAGDLPGPITNVAEATGIPPAGSPVTDTDTVTVELVAIDLVKEVSASLADVGDTLTYTYTVTNTGGVVLSNITLNDDVLGPITLASTTLAPGASTTGAAQYVVQLGDLPGPIVNLATVTGHSPGGLTVQDQDTQTVNLLARVSGHVWDDTPSPNGQYDGDESPLASVPITLTDGLNTWTTQTNGSGYYEFTGLTPGAYTISEQDPTGYSSTGDVDPPNDNQIHVTLQSGDNVTGRDFFDATFGSIGDFVWHDLDLDGLQDTGEPGINGVLVELLDDQGGLITTKTTAGGGLYLFGNLAANDYQVRIAASNFGPVGALFGYGHTSAATFGPDPQTITLAAGQNYLLADFGYARAGFDLLKTVSEQVVVSGAQVTYSYTFTNTGDTYLDNIVVTDNRLGQICPPPAIPALGPGDSFTCSKTVELTESVCNVGTVTGRAVDSKGTPLDGFTTILDQSDEVCADVVDARLSLTPAEAANEIGDDHVFTATLEFDYGDGNGWVAAPAGETIHFSIDSGPGGLSSNTCQTDGAGQCNVTLSSSTPGTTHVSASWSGTITTGLGSTAASANSNDAIKRWVDARISITPQQATNLVGESHTFTVTVEQQDGSGWGNAPDGTPVSFTLLNNTAGAFFVGGVNACTTTNGQCTVTINASQPGSVNVHASATFAVQGVSLTRETDGQGGNSGDATKIYVGAKIGDYVWEDIDGNGLQDEPASAGVNGVTVELYTAAGVFVADTVTANDGSGNPGYYLFDNVAPGDYYVKFIKPAGYEFTFQDVDDGNPNPDERDSDPDPATGQTASFTVAGSSVDLTRDAGLYRPVTLGDQTFVDTSGDGQPTNGELLLSNVLLEIDGPAGSFLVTTSGFGDIPSGNYLESGLHPGTYTVTAKSWPSGFVPTGPTQVTHTLVSGETNLTFDFPFINTTAITMLDFTAQRRSGGVLLRWATMSEAGNDGFLVYRAERSDGVYQRVSPALIASQAVGGGASYRWLDETAQPGLSYWYRLETAPDGIVVGPVQALGHSGRVFLPVLNRH